MFSNLTTVVKNLLFINIAILLIQQLLKIDFIGFGGLRYIHAETFLPFQFFTYMFIHGSFWHLFGNMLALFIFGPWLERVWGSRRFLAFYLITGVGAGAIWFGINYFETRGVERDTQAYFRQPDPELFNSYIVKHYHLTDELDKFIDDFADNPESESYKEESVNFVREFYYKVSNTPMVGASGAVFGILMAFGMLFPNAVLMLLFPPIPIKAKYFVLLYGLYELYAIIQQSPGDNVAHFAHLGGMFFAFILVKRWANLGF